MNTIALHDKPPSAEGDDGEEFTPEQLNRWEQLFLLELEELGLETDNLQTFLDQNPDKTLYSFHRQQNTLRERVLAKKIALLQLYCRFVSTNRQDFTENESEYEKKAAQILAIDAEVIKNDDKSKLLSIIDKYTPDTHGLNIDDKEAVDAFRTQLNKDNLTTTQEFFKNQPMFK